MLFRSMVRRFNRENAASDLRIDDQEEEQLVSAIICHSDKQTRTGDAFIELLKDVDSLDRYLHGVRTEGAYAERCRAVLDELGMSEAADRAD